MDTLVPKASERRTGGFRRLAGFDSSRPYGAASLGASRDRTVHTSALAGMATPTAWENQVSLLSALRPG